MGSEVRRGEMRWRGRGRGMRAIGAGEFRRVGEEFKWWAGSGAGVREIRNPKVEIRNKLQIRKSNE